MQVLVKLVSRLFQSEGMRPRPSFHDPARPVGRSGVARTEVGAFCAATALVGPLALKRGRRPI